VDAPRPRRRNAFSLPFFDIVALTMRHERQDLQYKVGYERTHQVFVQAGVKQGYINHSNVNAALFGEDAPLALYIIIIST